ncbi:proton-coupled zinc antiporter SLC30A2-like [Diadema antillarum]|uniref:proton-coupled zinc antiporter SLC30A2-like n=1 Tax=Diadema antillarum TaxID=105358 RepID=UPI003A89633F
MGSADTLTVALVDFASDGSMPQLVNDYYSTPEDRDQDFRNSRLVLHEAYTDDMQCMNHTQGVVSPHAGNTNTSNRYDSLDVATTKVSQGTGKMENGDLRINVAREEDVSPLNLTPVSDDSDSTAASREECCDYDHCHGPLPATSNKGAQRQLLIACCICVLFMIGEVVGGYLAHSLAIMTDAAHLLSDFASFLISIFSLWVARRPATKRMSFGYYRAEVIGAVISVLVIWILTGVLCYLAVQRIMNPDYVIHADVMLITAGTGVGINIILAIVLQSGGGHLHSHGGGRGHHHLPDEEDGATEGEQHAKKNKQKNLNVRAAFIHVIGDLIQSIGVLIAAGIIKANPEYKIADPICTFLFSILVLITTMTVLRDAMNVLMEGVPRHIKYAQLREDLDKVPGVRMAHSLHVWSLTTSRAAMAVHLAVDAETNNETVLKMASKMVRKKYDIHFTTIQVELYQHAVMRNCVRCIQPC